MKDIFIKFKEFCKTHKKRIITVLSISLITIVIVAGAAAGIIYSKANANIKYSEEQVKEIALIKVPEGEVLKVEKELNFKDAVFEYKVDIKDKENMLEIVKVDSQTGVILRVNNGDYEKENRGNNKENSSYSKH